MRAGGAGEAGSGAGVGPGVGRLEGGSRLEGGRLEAPLSSLAHVSASSVVVLPIEPGASAAVTFALSDRDLSIWDAARHALARRGGAGDGHSCFAVTG